MVLYSFNALAYACTSSPPPHLSWCYYPRSICLSDADYLGGEGFEAEDVHHARLGVRLFDMRAVYGGWVGGYIAHFACGIACTASARFRIRCLVF